MIGGGHLDRSDITRVSNISDQRNQLVAAPAIRDLVIDNTHVYSRQVSNLRQPSTEPARVLSLGIRICDKRAVRAIRKPFQDRQADIRPYPENGIGPGIDDRAEIRVAVQSRVDHDDHPGLDRPAQENTAGQRFLTLAILPYSSGYNSMRPAFCQSGQNLHVESAQCGRWSPTQSHAI